MPGRPEACPVLEVAAAPKRTSVTRAWNKLVPQLPSSADHSLFSSSAAHELAHGPAWFGAVRFGLQRLKALSAAAALTVQRSQLVVRFGWGFGRTSAQIRFPKLMFVGLGIDVRTYLD